MMRPYEIRERKAPFIYSSDTHSGPRHEEQWNLSLPVDFTLKQRGAQCRKQKANSVLHIKISDKTITGLILSNYTLAVT